MRISKRNARCELQGHDIYINITCWRNKTGREKDEFYDFVLTDTLNSHRVVVIRVSYELDKSADYFKTKRKIDFFFARVYRDKEGKTYYKGLGNKIYFYKEWALSYDEMPDWKKEYFED